jgi:hypothetical protein
MSARQPNRGRTRSPITVGIKLSRLGLDEDADQSSQIGQCEIACHVIGGEGRANQRYIYRRHSYAETAKVNDQSYASFNHVG